MHIVNKKKDNLIFGLGPTQQLDNTTLTTEAQDSITFLRSKRKFFLNQQYNGSDSFFCFNYKNISIQSKVSEIKKYPLCLGNISGDFSANNLKKKQD